MEHTTEPMQHLGTDAEGLALYGSPNAAPTGYAIPAPVWFTRYGTQFEGHVHDVNLAKGTAAHSYISKCSRCGGAGGSDRWKFTGWTCFECGGSGRGTEKTEGLYSAERLAKVNATQAKRDATRLAKAQAQQVIQQEAERIARAAFIATHPDFIADLDKLGGNDTFLADLAQRFTQYGTLTDAQVTAGQKAIDRLKARAAEQAQAANCPTGRIVMEGVILTVKVQESDFGPVTKILVKHNTGYKVWGTRPSGDGIGWAKVGDPKINLVYLSFSLDTKQHTGVNFNHGTHSTLRTQICTRRLDRGAKQPLAFVPRGKKQPL